MILDLSTDILLYVIVPILDNQSLARLSLSCKLLHTILSPRLFTRRSLYKIRTKRDFWKKNLDRHWKKVCPLEKREYHVVCEKHIPKRYPEYIQLSTSNIKSKIDVIESITIIGHFDQEKEKLFFDHFKSYNKRYKDADNQKLYLVFRIDMENEIVINDVYAEAEKLSDDHFAFHLKFDFPFLLYYIKNEELINEITNNNTITNEITIWIECFTRFPCYHRFLIPMEPENVIVQGYKIKDLNCNHQQSICNQQQSICNQQQSICNQQQSICNQQISNYNNDMIFFIRLPHPSKVSLWNVLRYNQGTMTTIYPQNFDSIKKLKSKQYNPNIMSKNYLNIIPKDD